MTDPHRFLAVYPDKTETSNDPQQIMRDAEAFSESTGEPVHLYQHVMTVQHERD